MSCRILIADDHGLFRDGLRAILSAAPGLEVVAEACDGRDAVRQAILHSPEVVSMDILMPGISGIEATQQIKRQRPMTRILAVTEQSSPEHVQEALRAGCDGYILKSARSSEFVDAIRFVSSGRMYIHPTVSGHLLQNYLADPDQGFQSSGWGDLTDKERSVVRLVAEGHTNRSTAEILNKSIKSIEKYRASLMVKLGLRSATELVVKAIENGWVDKEHVGIVHVTDGHRDRPSKPAPARHAPRNGLFT
ncbi:response regulator transcription factor [Ramlibacter sp. MMS24-I3-19]|uniref:response regulator transcription factor n=1 Tax=Ramlibacter sp. MMS24-I3-19 TaxID=3416606 RepID=UPI003D0211A6